MKMSWNMRTFIVPPFRKASPSPIHSAFRLPCRTLESTEGPLSRISSSESKGRRKIHKVMKEFKQGALKSGSGEEKVANRKQAVAIDFP